jgi:hypothetical protein
MAYYNDNDDIPIVVEQPESQDFQDFEEPPQPISHSDWLQDKEQMKQLQISLNNYYYKISSNMMVFIINSLREFTEFQVDPIIFDIPQCRVTIKVPGKKVCMYMVNIVSMFDLSISITPLTSKKEPSLIVDTPIEAVRILLATRHNI